MLDSAEGISALFHGALCRHSNPHSSLLLTDQGSQLRVRKAS